MRSILVADDERGVRLSLETLFAPEYRVLLAEDGDVALRLAEEQSPDVAIIDLRMPRMSGIELLPRLKAVDPHLPVIVLSAMHDVPNVVKAVRLGAAQYLTKPFDIAEIRLVVEMALRERSKAAGMQALETEINRWYDTGKVIGAAPAWQETLAVVRRAAEAPDTTVMLYGESGTGKELLARLIHTLGARRRGPLVPIHCAAVPETLLESELFGHEKGSFTGATERRQGCVEMADGGTLFLDEVGEMPAAMQSKLLRFLQDGQFMRVGGRESRQADVRVVGATNRDLRRGVDEGWFRVDLFYRLNVVPIAIPPLRQRPGDVRLLAEHFITAARRERRVALHRVSPAAMALLEAYPWPGNVRELRNLVERITVLHGDRETLEPDLLPPEFHPGLLRAGAEREAASPVPGVGAALPVSLDEQVAALEQDLIRRALSAAHGNLSQAAVLLRTTRRILSNKAGRYGIGARGPNSSPGAGPA
jgi:DNA-binding NtrC family response regulator